MHPHIHTSIHPHSGTLWDALGGSGKLWEALGGSGTLWDALGSSGTLWVTLSNALERSWDTLGDSGTLWDDSKCAAARFGKSSAIFVVLEFFLKFSENQFFGADRGQGYFEQCIHTSTHPHIHTSTHPHSSFARRTIYMRASTRTAFPIITCLRMQKRQVEEDMYIGRRLKRLCMDA